jgi:DNA-binding transcriptional MerR regulator
MLRIAKFAELAGVTTRLLRYYDSIGLFAPAQVDAQTGYRYYTVTQLPRLHRILALRALNMPLQHIAQMLDDNLHPAAAADILHQQRVQLALRMGQDFARLREASARIAHLDAQQPYPDVVIKPLLPLCGLHVKVALGDGETIAGVFRHLSDQLRASGAYTHVQSVLGFYPHHRMFAGIVNPFCFEALYVIPRLTLRRLPLTANERRFVPSTFKRVPMAACALHVGRHNRLFETYQVLLDYLRDYGYRPSSAPREVYLHTRGDPETFLTEIQIPIVPAAYGENMPLNVPA